MTCVCGEKEPKIYRDGRLWCPSCPVHGDTKKKKWPPGHCVETVIDFKMPPVTDRIDMRIGEGRGESLHRSFMDYAVKAIGADRDLMDTPQDDDPPGDPMAMLEVLEEAQEHYKEARSRAQDMQASAAIRAIFADGEDPRAVAEACGYDVSSSSRRGGPPTVDQWWRSMMGGTVVFEDNQPEASGGMEAFAQWLVNYLNRRVKGLETHA